VGTETETEPKTARTRARRHTFAHVEPSLPRCARSCIDKGEGGGEGENEGRTARCSHLCASRCLQKKRTVSNCLAGHTNCHLFSSECDGIILRHTLCGTRSSEKKRKKASEYKRTNFGSRYSRRVVLLVFFVFAYYSHKCVYSNNLDECQTV